MWQCSQTRGCIVAVATVAAAASLLVVRRIRLGSFDHLVLHIQACMCKYSVACGFVWVCNLVCGDNGRT